MSQSENWVGAWLIFRHHFHHKQFGLPVTDLLDHQVVTADTHVSLSRWDALRQLHEAYGVPLPILQAASPYALVTLEKRARREAWSQRSDKHQSLLKRLNAVLGRQLAEFERGLESLSAIDEKAARTLGTMARTWEKLLELEKGMEQNLEEDRGKTAGFTLSHSELDDLRAELERRIDALVGNSESKTLHKNTQSSTSILLDDGLGCVW